MKIPKAMHHIDAKRIDNQNLYSGGLLRNAFVAGLIICNAVLIISDTRLLHP